ncbi:hypothetical protein F7725_029181 [Dissostichus mawsoni]|uniref:Condensin-2 complex subunit G2 n=1 Tax=Dissostichus mawsoni TaxID=36200 RepID=A0A7J5XIF1_DISMA|nr:hypothetical protein F7725_029181 [Dissostichus mawsoni]
MTRFIRIRAGSYGRLSLSGSRITELLIKRILVLFHVFWRTTNMSKREAFLESCCTENVDDFLRFIQLHDVLQEERREEGSEERREEGKEEAMEVEAAADPNHVRSVVDGVALVAAESLKVLQDGETYSSLLEIIHRLHDMLELQPVSEAPLQLQILRLCDAWWKKDLKEKETVQRSRECVVSGRLSWGKRFMVFLFSWNINFISDNNGSYREIYFRAWKKAEGDFLEKIESSCIVSYFHSKKGCEKVDKMLSNLYKPILWKALTVRVNATNFEVRANATLLFTEAFPVLDMENSNKSKDEAIQKQLDTVMVLLDDPHPTVRSNAILGVCKILAKYWELLPAAIITDFLRSLMESCSRLCKFARNSEKVRIAFLDMLLKVKAARAAKVLFPL